MTKQIKKIVSLVTAFAFLFTNTGLHDLALAEVSSPGIQTEAALKLSIPAELGKIENLYSGSGPVIAHIQTAHGNYEAQKNIAAILKYLQKNYGFNTVLLEGSASALDAEMIRYFPNFPELNQKVVDRLTRQAIIKGPELFLLDTPKAQGFGIENLEAYKRNRELFISVIKERSENEALLKKWDTQVQRLEAAGLNAALKSFLDQEDAFEMSRLPLQAWLTQIKQKAAKELSVDLTSPAYQLDWPMLVRLFKLQEIEKRLDTKKLDTEKTKFLLLRQSQAIRRFLEMPLSQSELPDPQTRIAFEEMASRLGPNFDYSAYPNVTLLIAHLILQSELKSDRLMMEVKKISELIRESLAHKKAEKDLLQDLIQYRLLKKVFSLELTPSDFDELTAAPNFIQSLKAISGELTGEELLAVSHLYQRAFEFYQGAKARDQKMIENVEAKLAESGQSKVAVITGGFHAQPFKNYFTGKNYHYALISPKITSFEQSENERQNYIDSLLKKSTLETDSIAVSKTYLLEALDRGSAGWLVDRQQSAVQAELKLLPRSQRTLAEADFLRSRFASVWHEARAELRYGTTKDIAAFLKREQISLQADPNRRNQLFVRNNKKVEDDPLAVTEDFAISVRKLNETFGFELIEVEEGELDAVVLDSSGLFYRAFLSERSELRSEPILNGFENPPFAMTAPRRKIVGQIMRAADEIRDLTPDYGATVRNTAKIQEARVRQSRALTALYETGVTQHQWAIYLGQLQQRRSELRRPADRTVQGMGVWKIGDYEFTEFGAAVLTGPNLWQKENGNQVFQTDGPDKGLATAGGIPLLLGGNGRTPGGIMFTPDGPEVNVLDAPIARKVPDGKGGQHLQHGFGAHVKWRVESVDEASITFTISSDEIELNVDGAKTLSDILGSNVIFRQTYAIEKDGLTSKLTSDKPVLLGAGYHPYYVLEGEIEDWTFEIPASEYWATDSTPIPLDAKAKDVTNTDWDFRKPTPLRYGLELTLGGFAPGTQVTAIFQNKRLNKQIKITFSADHFPFFMVWIAPKEKMPAPGVMSGEPLLSVPNGRNMALSGNLAAARSASIQEAVWKVEYSPIPFVVTYGRSELRELLKKVFQIGIVAFVLGTVSLFSLALEETVEGLQNGMTGRWWVTGYWGTLAAAVLGYIGIKRMYERIELDSELDRIHPELKSSAEYLLRQIMRQGFRNVDDGYKVTTDDEGNIKVKIPSLGHEFYLYRLPDNGHSSFQESDDYKYTVGVYFNASYAAQVEDAFHSGSRFFHPYQETKAVVRAWKQRLAQDRFSRKYLVESAGTRSELRLSQEEIGGVLKEGKVLGLLSVAKLGREKTLELARRIAKAGGIPEIALRGTEEQRREALDIIRTLTREGLKVSAGSITSISQVEDAQNAGAVFIVTPLYNRHIVREAKEIGIGIVVGVSSFEEALQAYEQGLRVVKRFPASVTKEADDTAQIKAYLKAVLAPIPEELLKSHGIDLEKGQFGGMEFHRNAPGLKFPTPSAIFNYLTDTSVPSAFGIDFQFPDPDELDRQYEQMQASFSDLQYVPTGGVKISGLAQTIGDGSKVIASGLSIDEKNITELEAALQALRSELRSSQTPGRDRLRAGRALRGLKHVVPSVVAAATGLPQAVIEEVARQRGVRIVARPVLPERRSELRLRSFFLFSFQSALAAILTFFISEVSLKSADQPVGNNLRILKVSGGVVNDVFSGDEYILQLRSTNSFERAKAARSIANVRYIRAIPYLVPLLQDSEWAVRREVIQALMVMGKTGIQEIQAHLPNTQKDSELEAILNPAREKSDLAIAVKNGVESKTIINKGERAVPYLVSLLTDEYQPVRFYAELALSYILDPDIAAYLASVKDAMSSDRRLNYPVRKPEYSSYQQALNLYLSPEKIIPVGRLLFVPVIQWAVENRELKTDFQREEADFAISILRQLGLFFSPWDRYDELDEIIKIENRLSHPASRFNRSNGFFLNFQGGLSRKLTDLLVFVGDVFGPSEASERFRAKSVAEKEAELTRRFGDGLIRVYVDDLAVRSKYSSLPISELHAIINGAGIPVGHAPINYAPLKWGGSERPEESFFSVSPRHEPGVREFLRQVRLLSNPNPEDAQKLAEKHLKSMPIQPALLQRPELRAESKIQVFQFLLTGLLGLAHFEIAAQQNPQTFVLNPGDSIQQAVNQTQAGDEIVLKNGVYPDQGAIQVAHKLTVSGESQNGVVIQGGFVVSGIAADRRSPSDGPTFKQMTVNSDTVSGFTFSNTTGGIVSGVTVKGNQNFNLNSANFVYVERTLILNESAGEVIKPAVTINGTPDAEFNQVTVSVPDVAGSSAFEINDTSTWIRVANSIVVAGDGKKEFQSAVPQSGTWTPRIGGGKWVFRDSIVRSASSEFFQSRVVNADPVLDQNFAPLPGSPAIGVLTLFGIRTLGAVDAILGSRLQVEKLPDGKNVRLTVFATSPGTYQMEISEDLKFWQSIGETFVIQQSNGRFTATIPADSSGRFIRAVKRSELRAHNNGVMDYRQFEGLGIYVISGNLTDRVLQGAFEERLRDAIDRDPGPWTLLVEKGEGRINPNAAPVIGSVQALARVHADELKIQDPIFGLDSDEVLDLLTNMDIAGTRGLQWFIKLYAPIAREFRKSGKPDIRQWLQISDAELEKAFTSDAKFWNVEPSRVAAEVRGIFSDREYTFKQYSDRFSEIVREYQPYLAQINQQILRHLLRNLPAHRPVLLVKSQSHRGILKHQTVEPTLRLKPETINRWLIARREAYRRAGRLDETLPLVQYGQRPELRVFTEQDALEDLGTALKAGQPVTVHVTALTNPKSKPGLVVKYANAVRGFIGISDLSRAQMQVFVGRDVSAAVRVVYLPDGERHKTPFVIFYPAGDFNRELESLKIGGVRHFSRKPALRFSSRRNRIPGAHWWMTQAQKTANQERSELRQVDASRLTELVQQISGKSKRSAEHDVFHSIGKLNFWVNPVIANQNVSELLEAAKTLVAAITENGRKEVPEGITTVQLSSVPSFQINEETAAQFALIGSLLGFWQIKPVKNIWDKSPTAIIQWSLNKRETEYRAKVLTAALPPSAVALLNRRDALETLRQLSGNSTQTVIVHVTRVARKGNGVNVRYENLANGFIRIGRVSPQFMASLVGTNVVVSVSEVVESGEDAYRNEPFAIFNPSGELLERMTAAQRKFRENRWGFGRAELRNFEQVAEGIAVLGILAAGVIVPIYMNSFSSLARKREDFEGANPKLEASAGYVISQLQKAGIPFTVSVESGNIQIHLEIEGEKDTLFYFYQIGPEFGVEFKGDADFDTVRTSFLPVGLLFSTRSLFSDWKKYRLVLSASRAELRSKLDVSTTAVGSRVARPELRRDDEEDGFPADELPDHLFESSNLGHTPHNIAGQLRFAHDPSAAMDPLADEIVGDEEPHRSQTRSRASRVVVSRPSNQPRAELRLQDAFLSAESARVISEQIIRLSVQDSINAILNTENVDAEPLLDAVSERLGVRLVSNRLGDAAVEEDVFVDVFGSEADEPEVRSRLVDQIAQPISERAVSQNGNGQFVLSGYWLDAFKENPRALFETLRGVAELQKGGLKRTLFVLADDQNRFFTDALKRMNNRSSLLTLEERRQLSDIISLIRSGNLIQFVAPDHLENYIAQNSKTAGMTLLLENASAAVSGAVNLVVPSNTVKRNQLALLLSVFPFQAARLGSFVNGKFEIHDSARIQVVADTLRREIFPGAQVFFKNRVFQFQSFEGYFRNLYRSAKRLAVMA